MRSTEFQDEKSQILFVLSYMKGGTAGPWATQKINTILSDNDSAPKTFDMLWMWTSYAPCKWRMAVHWSLGFVGFIQFHSHKYSFHFDSF